MNKTMTYDDLKPMTYRFYCMDERGVDVINVIKKNPQKP